MKKRAEKRVSNLMSKLRGMEDEIAKSGIKPKWVIPLTNCKNEIYEAVGNCLPIDNDLKEGNKVTVVFEGKIVKGVFSESNPDGSYRIDCEPLNSGETETGL